MATTITNQATLTFNYGNQSGNAASNIATATLQGPVRATKTSLDTNYTLDEDITYIISIVNDTEAAIANITVSDDLGTYAVSPTLSVAPLTYTGPAQLFINGVFSGEIEGVTDENLVVFTIPSLASGETALIVYKAVVNSTAPLTPSSTIENTATVAAEGFESVTDSHVLTVEQYADVRIIKTMSPDPVTSGSTLTYNFDIFNYGNEDATNVVLTDAFSPAPTNITVNIDGQPVSASDYSYENGVLTLPANASATTITVPAATYTQDQTTGEVSLTPGSVNIVVTGTV